MMQIKRMTIGSLAACLLLASAFAGAKELDAGTVIQASNIDQLASDTFEGHTVESMLPDKLAWQVRNYGLKIKLRHSEPLKLDPQMVAATLKYSKDVHYDPKTNEVTGYRAGIPFPDVGMTDPDAAAKLIWNYYYASPVGQVMDFRKFAYLLIDGKSGLERVQHWLLLRYFMKNRVVAPNSPVEGDGHIFTKTLLFALYPQDIRGLGTFTLRYDSPQLEDSWVYIKSVRRTRRLSGGAWMDPIGGTDQLNDDIEIWNARPSWYKGFKLLGKRWVLAVAHSSFAWNDKGSDNAQQFPTVDLKDKPFWNPVEEWEPRQVYVIETIPPEGHPYSKKIVYMETQIPRMYFAEAYDKNGKFWKWMNFATMPLKGQDGVQTYVSSLGQIVDFKRMHATIFLSNKVWKTDTSIKADDVSLSTLESAGQ